MQFNEVDIKSVRNYAVHGAIGLLMSIGFGMILVLMFGILFGEVSIIGYSLIFVIYGAYAGYILGGNQTFSRLSILGAVAGVLSGALIILLGLFNFGQTNFLLLSVIVLVIAGFAFGLPKIKNMILLAASGAFGGAAGYGAYTIGENLIYYLDDVGKEGGLLPGFIMVFFLLLSIGIAGASIAVGMYFIERKAYTPREIPRFLKIMRISGIVLTLIAMFIFSFPLLSAVQYPGTANSIHISTGDEKITVYVPVLLDENGKLLEMYGEPEISGIATTAIIETNHGKALKISGSGVIDISMRQTYPKLKTGDTEKFMNGFTISTSNNTQLGEVGRDQTVDMWVYSENDIPEFIFFINRDSGMGRSLTLQTEQPLKLIRGWQVVKLSGAAVMYD